MPFALLVLILISYWEQWHSTRKPLRISIQTLSQAGRLCKGLWLLYPLISGTGISSMASLFTKSLEPLSSSMPHVLPRGLSAGADGQHGGSAPPCSAVLPPTDGFPESDTLTLLWSLAIFILFLSSLGDSAFPFMLAMEVQVNPSADSKVFTSSCNV